ncbi:methyltransferase family protein [Saccharata proteae CBS 121410]|uniref:Methyltransferase family protein n=1 Tax=Saccharata proteae CBS 121410 TaxID=1314787 RepID=A0A9P4HVL4_9PEZI|nr:methyltransferase family protein [Saccharata proteae CBS 121410]
MAEDDAVIHIPVADHASRDESSDSAFGDDLSDTTSVASTIWRHRFEHGRRYHKYQQGAYWGPNDDQQNDQLDIGHHMLRMMLHDKLYLAPIPESPQAGHRRQVLDVGCGTGIWCIDFADDHPSAEVTGIDLSPIQPTFAPPNCHFEIDDCCAPWTFDDNTFDMINVRCMFGSIADWPQLYREIHDHLKPGGWINQLEMSIDFKSDDGTEDPVMCEWSRLFLEAADKFGKTMRVVDNMKGWIADAGFQDVHEVKYKIPVGGWSSDAHLKELGKWNLLYCYHGAEGWAIFLLTHVMGWNIEEVQILVAKFKSALKNRKTHMYYDVSVVYAQKPMGQ